jgi:hypothetical protein
MSISVVQLVSPGRLGKILVSRKHPEFSGAGVLNGDCYMHNELSLLAVLNLTRFRSLAVIVIFEIDNIGLLQYLLMILNSSE